MKKSKKVSNPQPDKENLFISTAKSLGCDESDNALDKAFSKLDLTSREKKEAKKQEKPAK